MAKTTRTCVVAGAVALAMGLGACGDDDGATPDSTEGSSEASTPSDPTTPSGDTDDGSSTATSSPIDAIDSALSDLQSLMTSLLGISEEQIECIDGHPEVFGDAPTANTAWTDDVEAAFEECGLFEWAEEMFGIDRDAVVCLGEQGSTLDDLMPDIDVVADAAEDSVPELPDEVADIFDDCGLDPSVLLTPDPTPWVSNLLEGLFGLDEADADCVAEEMPDDAIENAFGAGRGPAVSIDPAETTPDDRAVGQEVFADDLFAALDACGVDRDELREPATED